MIIRIDNKDLNKIEEFLKKENIEAETYETEYEAFCNKEASFRINNIYLNDERLKYLSAQELAEVNFRLTNAFIYKDERVLNYDSMDDLLFEIVYEVTKERK